LADTHREVTRREFTRQSTQFERPGSLFADSDLLAWIGRHVPVAQDDVVLDVAGGTGHLARHLAARAAFVVVADLTVAMLEEGARATAAAGMRNVVFVEGDATALGFAGAQFDVVVSRFAWHHLDDVARAAVEMARVCRPGGTVAVMDLVSEGGEAGARHNALERLRDPSHTRALAEDELTGALAAAGVGGVVVAERRAALPAEAWLDRALPGGAQRAEVLRALQAEAEAGAAGRPTGMRAAAGEDGLTIQQRWVLARGTRE
jgi:SAM-dependent methyltransferase